ncbi:prenyltransferase/squalene oxidase repeat-containing protein [Paenibacillus sp. RC67]|uniref:terpene cyclase/mutase family protein n=1 Tax=Paenibacillus sp. RC67 TaxID=3039392 RepID=UPI0024ADE2FE|nr:prenyltransferase/squalene oxidase repeat-containing protein [Paenibacillus sp. RC67]
MTQINEMTGRLQQMQHKDGSWRLCFETGPATDTYMILLLRSLQRNGHEAVIRKLAERIINSQEENGAWKLFYDQQEGDLEATVEAYYALLYSGYFTKSDSRLQRAKQFILARGGLTQVKTMLTQAFLAITGQSPWPDMLKVPVEFMLAPSWFFFNIFDLSGHARVHLVPIMIMSNANYSIRTEATPDLSDLYVGEKQPFESHVSWIAAIHRLLEAAPFLHAPLHEAALDKAKMFMLDRIEPDGTLLTYSTATILMVFALTSLGFGSDSPVLSKAISSLNTLLCVNEQKAHLQVSTSTVWDTAMINCALQQAGISYQHPMIQNSSEYLLARQQTRYGDWALRCPDTPPGGWGFSNINTLYPDIDDSTAVLRAITPYTSTSLQYKQAWQNGLRWVLAMQNDDGGWSAFERESPERLTHLFAFEHAEDIILDRSTPDLTARTLLFLGKEAGQSVNRLPVQKSAQWIIRQQEQDGSWFGRWGICYIHGSSAAVTGLLAVGIPQHHPAIEKAARWMLSIQNSDGGWGESCYSDIRRRYVPLNNSTPSQTAWALDLLIDTHDRPSVPIQRGMQRLIDSLHTADWRFTYPTGSGLPGSVYINYHSGNFAWPLLTLSKYLRKYGSLA